MDNEPSAITPDQIEVIERSIKSLAAKGNPFATGITQSLKGKTAAERRSILLGSYAYLYETMLTFTMSIHTKNTPAQVDAFLTHLDKDNQP